MCKKFCKKNPGGGHNSNSFRMSKKPLDGKYFLALREAIKSGASNLNERLFIQLDPDKSSNIQYLRRGHVQVGGWVCVIRNFYFLI